MVIAVVIRYKVYIHILYYIYIYIYIDCVRDREILPFYLFSYTSIPAYPTLPTLPYPTLSYPTLPYPTLPYPTLPYPTLPYPTRPASSDRTRRADATRFNQSALSSPSCFRSSLNSSDKSLSEAILTTAISFIKPSNSEGSTPTFRSAGAFDEAGAGGRALRLRTGTPDIDTRSSFPSEDSRGVFFNAVREVMGGGILETIVPECCIASNRSNKSAILVGWRLILLISLRTRSPMWR